MDYLQYAFWICAALVFYTYLGYGLLLGCIVCVKKCVMKCVKLFARKKPAFEDPEEWPAVTLLICAFNEELFVVPKMQNCCALIYPRDKLYITWVTDGSYDCTNLMLDQYHEINRVYSPERRGKTAALNHGMQTVRTPYTIFTDANTFLSPTALKDIVRCFLKDERVGCVAGEKRIWSDDLAHPVGGGEGLYWKYESLMKRWDSELNSTMGAAGELFGIRTSLWQDMSHRILLDDFYLSMRIVQKGYKIEYCKEAFAVESSSINMQEEAKRKVRIAAGGLQSIWLLRDLLNPLDHPLITFQYVSHRVLRWSITPVALFALVPLNVILMLSGAGDLYIILWMAQVVFYIAAYAGFVQTLENKKTKILYIPYYFVFMNVSVFKAIFYLRENKDNLGVWKKAVRA